MKTLYETFNEPDYLFDSHCHLNYEGFDPLIDEILGEMQKVSVKTVFDIAVNIESSKKSLEISKKYPFEVKSFVGIDPDVFIPGTELFIGFDINDSWFEEQFEILTNLIDQNSEFIAGVGESGIDNYWINHESNANLSSEERELSLKLQRKLFDMHIQLAEKHKLPMSIHSRKAEELCMEIIKNVSIPGIFHSYTGDYETAKKVLDRGWGLGINGIITFKNANDLRSVYKKIIGESSLKDKDSEFFYKKNLFFETDGPFLAPEGKRGEVNKPENIAIIFNKFKELLT